LACSQTLVTSPPGASQRAKQLGANVDEITAEYKLDHRGADLQEIDVSWSI